MKKIFVPQGTVERHENLYADEINVKGQLIVNGIIRAKRINGDGIILAQRIIANSIVADSVEVRYLTAEKVIVSKLFCETASVSAGIIAKDCIEGDCIKTHRLTANISEIKRLQAKEIVYTTQKRGFLALLFTSCLHERFAVWRHNRITKVKSETPIKKEKPINPADIEFENIMKDYREKFRKGGYRLVLEATESTPKAV